MSTVLTVAKTESSKLPAERREAVEALPESLQPIYTKLRDYLLAGVRQRVLSRHAIGEEVSRVTENETKYGDQAIPLLAAALGISDQLLWACRLFARTYEKDYLLKLLTAAEKRNLALSWTHFEVLSGAKGGAPARQRLEKQILEQGLSTDQLRLQVAGSLSRGKGGRQVVLPKTPLAALKQMTNLRDQIEARMTGWEQMAVQAILELSPSEVTDDLLDNLMTTQEAERHVARRSDDMADRLQEAIERVAAVLAKRPKAAEETDEDEEETLPVKPAKSVKKKPVAKKKPGKKAKGSKASA